MSEQRNPVVASVASRSQHPYSSIAVSPDRKNAVLAGKDTLRVLSVGAQGLREIRSLRISQHFQTQVAATATRSQPRYGDVRDAFALPKAASPQNMVSSTLSVVVTDVAWSLPQVESDPDSSIVAAAGSNGVVVVWNAKQAFLHPTAASAMGSPPDAVLTQHSRAVNRLAWHPNPSRPGYLLTASQDATVRLWQRRSSSSSPNANQGNQNIISWFKQSQDSLQHNESVSWHCVATFEPKAEAVRDIKWSPAHEDVFAMVTDTGALIVYNINVPATPWVRIQAHDGEASSVDWHPSRPYIVATGGAGDRSVKIWDLERDMSLHSRGDINLANRGSVGSAGLSEASDASDTDHHADTTLRAMGSSSSHNPQLLAPGSLHGNGHGSVNKGPIHTLTSARGARAGKTRPYNLRHILYIAASVTRVIWRPPAGPHTSANMHDGMLAVATSPIKGASAGGNGMLSLWSTQRPYMALSVVEGHKEGAVTDFIWVDIPVDEAAATERDQSLHSQSERTPRSRAATPVSFMTESSSRSREAEDSSIAGRQRGRPSFSATPFPTSFASSVASRAVSEESTKDRSGDSSVDFSNSLEGTWQHVLSVGRDGRCVVQSFARGDRPISRVSPSCFAMANLSPFQRGCGSLQIFSVHQQVPHGRHDDYALTGLRQDSATSRAPGVFREPMISSLRDGSQQQEGQTVKIGQRLPNASPQLVFNVIDQGNLDKESKPMEAQETVVVGPEVVHLSRFADSYKVYTNEEFPTRVSLCFHNGSIAQELKCGPLARMWRMVATMLQGSGMDRLPPKGAKATNALQFALVPCMRKLLEERANAGDVQTCVALCEILQVIQLDGEEASTCIPGLELNLVREWYLSYIDLLQQMCLFSHASSVIGKCKDPFIGALNKQSTTIHEACPHCGKALLVGEGENLQDRESSLARRSCNSCRRRIGFCFLCHEPVTGMYVWCPGCGHGGHLDHALEWFGGLDGNPVREMCPTGCGHRCNLAQMLSSFPTTCRPIPETAV